MILGGLAAICFAMPGVSFIAYPLVFVAGWMARVIIKGSAFLAEIPFAYVNIDKMFLYLWLSFSLIAFAFAILLYKKSNQKKVGLTVFLSMMMLVTAIVSYALLNGNTTSITVIDAGNSSASVIMGEGKATLIGCGGNEYEATKLFRSLEGNDIVTVDYLLIPRTEDTEARAAYDVASKYSPKMIVMPELNTEFNFLKNGESLKITEQASFTLWENAKVDYLYRDRLSCAYANISGVKILFLFYPGCDVTLIPKNWKNADILICRSKTPSELDLSGFKKIVISAEKAWPNMQDVYDRVSSDNLIVTAGQGNIIIDIKNESTFSIRRER
jgi:hypothetical protein